MRAITSVVQLRRSQHGKCMNKRLLCTHFFTLLSSAKRFNVMVGTLGFIPCGGEMILFANKNMFIFSQLRVIRIFFANKNSLKIYQLHATCIFRENKTHA